KDGRKLYKERLNDHAKHRPSSQSLASNAGENLSRVSRPGCHGKMASAKWFHRQSPSHGCDSRRQLQDVVYKLYDAPEPFFRRRVPGAASKRAYPSYRQVRRSKLARCHARHSFLNEGFSWYRVERYSGRYTR